MGFLFVAFIALAQPPTARLEIGLCGDTATPDVRRIELRAWPGPGAREARLAMWKAFADGQRKICFAGKADTPDMRAALETAGVIMRNLELFAPLTRREMRAEPIDVAPSAGIAVRVLESADAIVIVGLNESEKTRRVKITFPPSLPEAIWQDMEAGNAVHFVMEKRGPVYTHSFAPHDVLVLAIRKRLR
jgi:hypothetical protein